MRHQYRFLAHIDSDDAWKVDEEELHHLKRVLRLNTGDTVEFFDGNGTIGTGILQNTDGTIKPSQLEKHDSSPYKLCIAMGVLRPGSADELIPQLVEAGADEVFFFMQEGTSKQHTSPKVQKRWERIALSSARQCKRPFLMKMKIFNTLEDVIGCVEHFCAKIHLAPGANTSLIEATSSKQQGNICIVLGSEKGLLSQEEQALDDHGFKRSHLGQGILRATTAALLATGIAAIHMVEAPCKGDDSEKQKKP